MRLRQLEYVEEVLRRGSLKQAAAVLHVTEATLSQQIRLLEDELGVRLIQRRGKGMASTAEGDALVPNIHRILADVEDFRLHTQDLLEFRRGMLRIGTTHSGAMTVLPQVLRTFAIRYPGIALEVHEEGTMTIIERLSAGEVDVAIIATSSLLPLSVAEVVHEPLFEGHLKVICGRGHPLAKKAEVTRAELASQRLVLYRQGYLVLHLCLTFVLPPDATKSAIYYTDNTASIREMVSHGVGIGFLPDYVEHEDMYVKSGRMVFLPLADLAVPLGLSVAYCQNRYLSRAATEFIRLLRHAGGRFKAQLNRASPRDAAQGENPPRSAAEGHATSL